MYMSIQILKTPVPQTSHFNAHFYHLSAAVQLTMRTWKSNAANAIFASLFPRLVQNMPLINDLKAADSSIKGAIFGRYMQLPSLKQQPSYTFKGLLNDDVWRCVMMCHDVWWFAEARVDKHSFLHSSNCPWGKLTKSKDTLCRLMRTPFRLLYGFLCKDDSWLRMIRLQIKLQTSVSWNAVDSKGVLHCAQPAFVRVFSWKKTAKEMRFQI